MFCVSINKLNSKISIFPLLIILYNSFNVFCFTKVLLGSKIKIYLPFEDKTPKEANYIYFNYKSSFTVELNNAEITLTDQENNNPDRPGDMGGKRPGEKNEENYSSRYFLRVFNIILIIWIIL